MANLRRSYMENWSRPSPRALLTQYASVREMDRFVKLNGRYVGRRFAA